MLDCEPSMLSAGVGLEVAGGVVFFLFFFSQTWRTLKFLFILLLTNSTIWELGEKLMYSKLGNYSRCQSWPNVIIRGCDRIIEQS